MDELKKKIVKYFVFCAVMISVLESIIDFIFEGYVFPAFEHNKTLFSVSLAFYIVISIGAMVFVAICFSRIVGRKFVDEARKQIDEQNMLYANIVHDLKTPMTSIVGFSQALRDGKVNECDRAEIEDTIYRKTKHTNELLDTLFRYTKLSTPKYALMRADVNVCRLVREAVAAHYEMFEQRRISLEMDIPDEQILLSLDKHEFSRAVENLIVNAFVHNPPETKVLVSLKPDHGAITILVADDGARIPHDIQGALFEPFVRGDSSRGTNAGSGLGLAIAAAIVQKHGGTLQMVECVDGFTKAFQINLK